MATRKKKLPKLSKKPRRSVSPRMKGEPSPKPRARATSRLHQVNLKTARSALHELTQPVTVRERLAWLETRGAPDYLALARMEQGAVGAERWYLFPPVPIEEQRAEVQAVYRESFAQSQWAAQKKKVLRSYTANFPHLAFDPDSWLWPLWQEWRARYEPADRQLLSALANGIKGRGAGWMSSARYRAWILGQARLRLAHLKKDRGVNNLYKQYLEGTRSRDGGVQMETRKRVLPRLVERIQQLSGHLATGSELQKWKLSGVLRRAVARSLGVRERDLH